MHRFSFNIPLGNAQPELEAFDESANEGQDDEEMAGDGNQDGVATISLNTAPNGLKERKEHEEEDDDQDYDDENDAAN